MADKKETKKENTEKSNKGMMIVLFILGLLVLGAATFGGVYLFMKTKANVDTKPVIVEKTYVSLGEITVNLADEGGKRYFKGDISVGYDNTDKEAPKELTKEKSLVVVNDAVIFYFKGQKSEFINNVANEEIMKKQLMEAINKQLMKCKVTDIRFNSIIVQ